MGFQLQHPRPTKFDQLTIVFDGHSKTPDIDIAELESAFNDFKGATYVLKKSEGDKIWELSILFDTSSRPTSEEAKSRLEGVASLPRTDPLIHIPNDGAYRCHTINQFTS